MMLMRMMIMVTLMMTTRKKEHRTSKDLGYTPRQRSIIWSVEGGGWLKVYTSTTHSYRIRIVLGLFATVAGNPYCDY